MGVRGLREAFLNSQGGTQVCGVGYFDACFGASACLFDTFARSEDAAGTTCLRSGVRSCTIFRESITWIYAKKTVRWRASNRCFVPSETLTVFGLLSLSSPGRARSFQRMFAATQNANLSGQGCCNRMRRVSFMPFKIYKSPEDIQLPKKPPISQPPSRLCFV